MAFDVNRIDPFCDLYISCYDLLAHHVLWR